MSALTSLPPISARRRRTDKIMRGATLAATIVALIPPTWMIDHPRR